MCAYFQCHHGSATASLDCGTDAWASTSAAGVPGCCSLDATLAPASLDCLGTLNEQVDVTLRVAPASAAAQCISYSVQYHF